MIIRFSLSEDSIDPLALHQALPRLDAGGYCSFEGWARDNNLGKTVTQLTYEAYVPLALKQGRQSFGRLSGVSKSWTLRPAIGRERCPPVTWPCGSEFAPHRAAAFEACRYLIDRIKETVPIWKFEAYSDGTNEWLDPTDCGCAKKQTCRDDGCNRFAQASAQGFAHLDYRPLQPALPVLHAGRIVWPRFAFSPREEILTYEEINRAVEAFCLWESERFESPGRTTPSPRRRRLGQALAQDGARSGLGDHDQRVGTRGTPLFSSRSRS